MQVEDLRIWEAFQAVALHGNFSKSAQHLRISVPQLSRRVAQLEAGLGVRLFQRSTRRVALTDEGRSLLPKIQTLLEDLRSLERSFERVENLSGTIRVTSVPFVAQRLLMPALTQFAQQHPNVQIELDLSENLLNLSESDMDLAIRIHDEPPESSHVYKKLAPNELILCATPAYLKKSKSPLRHPQDLRRHQLLYLDVHAECRFENLLLRLAEFASDRRFRCNSGWYLTELALHDAGILVRSIWDVQAHLHAKKLVRVLKEFPLQTFGHIYAVIPSRRLLAPRVRELLDQISRHAKKWKVGAF